MEILNLKIANLHNEEHFQFHTECNSLFKKYTSAALGIDQEYPVYSLLLDSESEALKKIRASAHTKNLADADYRRDAIYRGMYGIARTACTHFRDDVKQAALRLRHVLDNFGNIAMLPYDEESAALAHLLDDLEGDYASDLAITGLTEWVAELRSRNAAFNALIGIRYDESAGKTQVNLRATRLDMDATYQRMATWINAMALLNKGEGYNSFITDLNLHIKHFNTLIALRKGRTANQGDGPVAALE